MPAVQHTPGPWEVSAERGILPGYVAISSFEPARNGCQSWIGLAHVAIRDEGEAEINPVGEANARLIAAAPQLLEALKELLAHASFVGIAPHYAALARAAIAEAEGVR